MALTTSEKPTNLFTVICLLGSIGLVPFIVSVGRMVSGAWSGGGFAKRKYFWTLCTLSIFGLQCDHLELFSRNLMGKMGVLAAKQTVRCRFDFY